MAARQQAGLQRSMLRMAREDPELAGRLFVTALPASATTIHGQLHYRLDLEHVGSFDVDVRDGEASVTDLNGVVAGASANGASPDFVMRTDPLTLARMATGTSPLRMMLSGRLRIRGKRRRATRLRQMAGDLSMRDIVRAGVRPDPDLVYRSLPYAIEPEWTRGHNFCIAYNMEADETGGGGTWYLIVDDGSVEIAREPPPSGVDSTLSLSHGTWLGLMSGDLNPPDAMRTQLTRVDGRMHPVTIFGRWIERAEGRDDRELEREARQRAAQGQRATWGSKSNGSQRAGQGDPAVEQAGQTRVRKVQLLSYEELYALWERQNWKAHEIDFTVDKQQWLATPTDGQQDTLWSLGNFYVGEERVAADLAPFVLAAPSGEVEIFLATQLVDEARHAAFFDRFMAEVLVLEPDDIRGRLATLEDRLGSAWRELFDDNLRDIAKQIQSRPHDMDLFVEGITVYHLVIEGVLAMTGQHQILKYLGSHDIYPGFQKGFSLVEQDEHRHIAFGVRFLRDAVEAEPRYRDLIERKIAELVPRAAYVFVPPHVDDPTDFVSYDYHSSEIYGFAYRALKRRMNVIGVEIPPASELMPGAIDEPAATAA